MNVNLKLVELHFLKKKKQKKNVELRESVAKCSQDASENMDFRKSVFAGCSVVSINLKKFLHHEQFSFKFEKNLDTNLQSQHFQKYCFGSIQYNFVC